MPRPKPHNTVQGVPCYVCGGILTYNGNYYCLDCDWVMDQAEGDGRGSNPQDVVIIRTYLQEQRDYSRSKGDHNRAETMAFYLGRLDA